MGKANKDRAAEKAVKARIQKTHLRSFRIVGSEKNEEGTDVFVLRMFGGNNYLFKIKTKKRENGTYDMSGFVPITDYNDFGDYKAYNLKPAGADALKPTEAERKKFKGYR